MESRIIKFINIMTKKERGYLTELYYFALSFFVYGFLGWCTEVAYAAAKQGKFVNRGFLNGPICPVYGIGVGVFFLLFKLIVNPSYLYPSSIL